MLQVVVYHVLRLRLDGGIGLKVGVPGAIAQNLEPLLNVVIAENVFKGGVHGLLIGHLGIVGAAFIDDLQGHAVVDGLPHGVLVYVVAKDPLGLVNGCSGVADAACVGDTFVEIGAQHGILGTVGLVGHDQDVGACVQLRKCLG